MIYTFQCDMLQKESVYFVLTKTSRFPLQIFCDESVYVVFVVCQSVVVIVNSRHCFFVDRNRNGCLVITVPESCHYFAFMYIVIPGRWRSDAILTLIIFLK